MHTLSVVVYVGIQAQSYVIIVLAVQIFTIYTESNASKVHPLD